jgi:L-threonylcarbamoyladenylate synthase
LSETVSIAADGSERAKDALERSIGSGGVALFPADTVYGLGADPVNDRAVERIYELKGREARKPAAVMYFSPLALRELLDGLGPGTREAIAALLPGPLTLVVANPERRYPLACSEDPERLGVRLIEGPLSGVMTPILQTSANLSGKPPAARFEDVDPAIRSAVDLAIDGGELGGAPSTVIDLTKLDAGGGWRIIREGAVSAAEVERRLA